MSKPKNDETTAPEAYLGDAGEPAVENPIDPNYAAVVAKADAAKIGPDQIKPLEGQSNPPSDEVITALLAERAAEVVNIPDQIPYEAAKPVVQADVQLTTDEVVE